MNKYTKYKENFNLLDLYGDIYLRLFHLFE